MSVSLAMNRSGLNGSFLGSMNTHGTGMYAASADAAKPARQTRAAQSQDLAAIVDVGEMVGLSKVAQRSQERHAQSEARGSSLGKRGR